MSGRGRGGGKWSGSADRPGRGRGRGGVEAAEIEPGEFPIDTGTAEVLPDPWTDGAWLLKVNGVESSQLNPGQPLEMGFEYMRWAAAVMMHRWTPDTPLRVLHLGGAGCTLARWARAWFPDSRQTAVELDAGLALAARERFGLPRAPALRIRVEEAGATLAGAHPDSRDVIIRDVFAGTGPSDQITPPHLTGLEAGEAAARTVGPGGLYLVNFGGGPDLTLARREVSTLRQSFATVGVIADSQMLKGRRRGNIILAACQDELTRPAAGGRDGLVRHLLADPLPARLIEPAADFAAGAPHLTAALQTVS